MLEDITKRLKRDRRGVSNVIVVMLSLPLVVVIVANVVLWSYEMNQFDWDKMQEDIGIANVEHVNRSSWFATQSEYTVNTGSHTSGTFKDTQAIDDQYESFVEGSNWWNVDYSYRRQITITNNMAYTLSSGYSTLLTMDTAALVSSGKMLSNGNDLRIVFWNESSWVEIDRHVIDMNTGSTHVWFKTQTDVPADGSDNNYYVYYDNLGAVSPPANKSNVYLWFDDFNRVDNLDITTEASYSAKTGGGTWSIETSKLKNVGAAGDPNKLIITALGNVDTDIDMLVKINVTSFVGGDLSRMGLSCCMDTDPSRGSGYCGLFHDDRDSLELLNDLRSWGTGGAYSWSLSTWYYMRFRVIDPVNKLGKVKVWQVGTTEPNTWTVDGNFGGGTARNYGEVGFGGSRTTDITYFDDILIRYIADPEPSASLGTEQSQSDNRLDIDGTFVIDLSTYPLTYIQTGEMQIRYRSSDASERWYLKAYNWSSSTYSDSGFNSTTGHMPTKEWDYYAVNFTDRWSSYVHDDGTVYIKIVDEGADSNNTIIDIDFLAIRLVIDGTRFTFQNRGPSSSHLVSLWVNNSTHHQRFDINIFINSGDTESHIRSDVTPPNKPYTVKVITESGNTAVFASQ